MIETKKVHDENKRNAKIIELFPVFFPVQLSLLQRVHLIIVSALQLHNFVIGIRSGYTLIKNLKKWKQLT